MFTTVSILKLPYCKKHTAEPNSIYRNVECDLLLIRRPAQHKMRVQGWIHKTDWWGWIHKTNGLKSTSTSTDCNGNTENIGNFIVRGLSCRWQLICKLTFPYHYRLTPCRPSSEIGHPYGADAKYCIHRKMATCIRICNLLFCLFHCSTFSSFLLAEWSDFRP